jgi:multiple sugar transport system substrate-binding protein
MKYGKRITAVAITAALASIGLSGLSQGQGGVTLNALFMKQAAYSEDDVKSMAADFEKSNPNIKVNLEFVPYEALRDKTIAAQASGGYDVVLFDTIWPAEYATNGFVQDVSARINQADIAKIFPGAWTTVQYKSKYYGLPWILDTKYLYYNTDILKRAGIKAPPKTYQELMTQSETIKKKGLVKHPLVSSWSQAEALVADYTMYLAAFGGSFLNKDDQPAFQTGGGLKALEWMVDSLKRGVSNPNSKEYLEEDVRRVFSSGQAAFALNWTYMYNLTQDKKESKVVGKVGIVPAPGAVGGAKVSAVNGSMGLGITSGSQHPDEAWKFISAITSQRVQNKYAKLSLPIWKSSYSDPAVTKGQEAVVRAANTSIGAMFPRPTVARYSEFSTILQKALQEALLGKKTAKAALEDAAKQASALK